jgi:hypothetical protein
MNEIVKGTIRYSDAVEIVKRLAEALGEGKKDIPVKISEMGNLWINDHVAATIYIEEPA